MSRQRIRSVNFTPQEVILLVDIVIKYPDILESKQADAIMWRQKNQIWNSITKEFNEQNKNVIRDTKTLRLKYDCLKREVKNKIMKNKCEEISDKQLLLNHEEKLANALNIKNNEGTKIKIENDIKDEIQTTEDETDGPSMNQTEENDIESVTNFILNTTKNNQSMNFNLDNSKNKIEQGRFLANIQVETALKTHEYMCKKIEFLKEEHELTIKKLKLEIQEKQLGLLSNYCMEERS